MVDKLWVLWKSAGELKWGDLRLLDKLFHYVTCSDVNAHKNKPIIYTCRSEEVWISFVICSLAAVGFQFFVNIDRQI